jgi:hypothetical protein
MEKPLHSLQSREYLPVNGEARARRDEAAAWRRPAPRFGRARPDGPGSVNSAGGEALGTFRGNVLTAQQYSYSDLEVFAC